MKIIVTRIKSREPEHPDNFTLQEMSYDAVLSLLKNCNHPADKEDWERLKRLVEGHLFFTDHLYEYKIQIRKESRAI